MAEKNPFLIFSEKEEKELARLKGLWDRIGALITDCGEYPTVNKLCMDRGLTILGLKKIQESVSEEIQELEETKAQRDAIHTMNLIQGGVK